MIFNPFLTSPKCVKVHEFAEHLKVKYYFGVGCERKVNFEYYDPKRGKGQN